jgi:hypothetical protein
MLKGKLMNDEAIYPRDETLLARLRALCTGLTWESETDEPLRVFLWEGSASEAITQDTVVSKAGLPPDIAVERMTVEAFFRNAVTDEDWYEEEDLERARRFREIEIILVKELKGTSVFLMGRINREVFIVGRFPSGLPGGLRTRVVET